MNVERRSIQRLLNSPVDIVARCEAPVPTVFRCGTRDEMRDDECEVARRSDAWSRFARVVVISLPRYRLRLLRMRCHRPMRKPRRLSD